MIGILIEPTEINYDVEWEFIVDAANDTNENLVDRLSMYSKANADLERTLETCMFSREATFNLYSEQRMIYNIIKSEILLRMENANAGTD